MTEKISADEIRERFDQDVTRFTDEMSGQATIVDAPLVLAMIEESIAEIQPEARTLCDIGCGGGNFALRIARKLPKLNVTLLDLSLEMLNTAAQRLKAENLIVENVIQDDIRHVEFPAEKFDIIIASAVLHHLRTRNEWEAVFRKIHHAIKPGGAFWMTDLVKHENEAIERIQKKRYAEFLTDRLGKEQQEHVFDQIEASDTPETSTFLLRTLEKVGFCNVDIIHKNMTFATFLAMKK